RSFLQACGAADVVDVAVRDHNLLQRELVLREESEDLRNVVAGVDDHRFAGRLVAENRAVALERADGKGLEDHASIVEDGRRNEKGQASEACPLTRERVYLLFGVL